MVKQMLWRNFLILLTLSGCATFYDGNIHEVLTHNRGLVTKRYQTACVSLKEHYKSSSEFPLASATKQQFFKNEIQETNYFEKVYMANSNILKCDLTLNYVLLINNEDNFRNRIWRYSSAFTLGIIPYKANRSVNLTLEAIDEKTKHKKEFKYDERYVFWYSIVFSPLLFFPNYYSDQKKILKTIINHSIISAIKEH